MKGFIKKIEQINFGLMSPEDIRNMSVVTVETPDTYEDDGFPIEKGLMDPRLGVIDPSLVCRTCGFRGGDCQGHFGSIELARATAALMDRYDAAIWAHHGMFATGKSYDTTFGLMHTVEKSSGILLKQMSTGRDKLSRITPDQFRELAGRFGLTLDEKFL